jgi:hypothetical protein
MAKYSDRELKQAAYVKARFNLPDTPEYSELIWVKVYEVQALRHKVIGRIYKNGGITGLKMGDSVAVDYDAIEDMRGKTSVGVAEMLASLD